MIKIGKLTLNGTPRVAVGFSDLVSDDIIQDIEKFGLDVVELRVDQYSSFDPAYVVKQIQRFKDFPSIATIRSEQEGGGSNLSDQQRLDLFREVIAYVDAIDIELSSRAILKDVVKIAHNHKKLIMISYHDFDKTPAKDTLENVLNESFTLGADIVKIATLALSRNDVQLLADFTLHNKGKNIITIAMGSEGTLSRVFFPSLGSLLTYASLGKATAPGQLDYHRTVDLLRLLYPKYNQEKIQTLKLLELA